MPSILLSSPIGPLRLTAEAERLTRVEVAPQGTAPDASASPLLDEAAAQLAAYFDRRLTRFDLPLAPSSTPRGAVLRAAITAVGFGETARYGDIARMHGSSSRAVGQACARNPLPLIVPCHRILATDPAREHYSAGAGVPTKRWLLNHERRT